MTDATPTTPDSATQPEAEEKPKLLLQLLDAWHNRVSVMTYKRGSQAYRDAQLEYWLGAALAAEFLGQPLGPIVPIYLMSGRDLLDLRDKVNERAEKIDEHA